MIPLLKIILISLCSGLISTLLVAKELSFLCHLGTHLVFLNIYLCKKFNNSFLAMCILVIPILVLHVSTKRFKHINTHNNHILDNVITSISVISYSRIFSGGVYNHDTHSLAYYILLTAAIILALCKYNKHIALSSIDHDIYYAHRFWYSMLIECILLCVMYLLSLHITQYIHPLSSNSLLIIPGSIALDHCTSFNKACVCSASLTVFGCIISLILSYFLEYNIGLCCVGTLFTLYAISSIYKFANKY